MQYRNLSLLTGLILLLLSAISCRDSERQATTPTAQAATVEQDGEPILSEMPLEMNDLMAGDGRDFAIMDAGMGIAEDAESAEFTTPVLTAAHAFNYVVPVWEATMPLSSTININIRTAPLKGEWSDWHAVEIDPDAGDFENGLYSGNLISAGDGETAITHARVEVTVELYANDTGESPVMQAFNLVFIDSTRGATTEELLDELRHTEPQGKVNLQARAHPRPTIIPRSSWCNHSACDYSSGLHYETVSHLVVHHTVSNNATDNWAANVRAIWSFHTFKKDWGDVGYNYLIDPNGVIYEGHNGGDDVIGTHAREANQGSMGVALLGTFIGYSPPEVMLDSLAELLAWKADQRDIDLWDASQMPLLDWGHLHLIGHRDVYGTTVCPGTDAHSMLDEVRARVDAKLGRIPDFTYIDDRDDGYTNSQANWYNGPFNCGFNSHAFYTFSTTDASISTNQGEWRPDIDIGGTYEVEVFAPFCATGQGDSRAAPFTIFDANGQHSVNVNQSANLGLWVPLGEYEFTPGGKNVIQLDDLTTNDDGRLIWHDAVRYRLVEAGVTVVANAAPIADEWLTDRIVTFRWGLAAGSPLSSLRVQVATDSSFNTFVLNRSVATDARELTQTFDRDYAELHWRVVAVENDGTQTVSESTRFQLDAGRPTSAVNNVQHLCNGDYTLEWSGTDGAAGIKSYDIAFKRQFDTAWTTILNDTELTRITFRPPTTNSEYRFRAQAVDNVGNVELLKADGDIGSDSAVSCNTDVPINIEPIDGVWATDPSVTFNWQLAEPTLVENTTVEVATDEGFNNIILSESVADDTQSYRHSFDQDYRELFWRVRSQTEFGLELVSATTRFGLDATAPTSAVSDVWQTEVGDYMVFWGGNDELSGLESYTIEYRTDESDRWLTLLAVTDETDLIVRLPSQDRVYRFRSRARDAAGNFEEGEFEGDFDTAQACPYIDFGPNVILPEPDGWQGSSDVSFAWETQHPSCIVETFIEISVNADFTSLLAGEPVIGRANTFDFTFPDLGVEVWWRVSQTTILNETFVSEPARFGFDTTAPESTITQLIDLGDQLWVIADGDDAESGVRSLVYESRRDGTNEWVQFVVPDSPIFTPPDDALYWFRSLAIDRAGNVETKTGDGDTSSDAATVASERTFLPLIGR